MLRSRPLLAKLPPLLLCCAWSVAVHAQDRASVTTFSPQGAVKEVRQAAARFSTPMVSFGDPEAPDPFTVDCAVSGTGRWVDARHWVLDFDQDLPAGIACEFTAAADLTDLDGRALEGTNAFSFTTGGPMPLQTMPYEGTLVDEEQVFLLGLDAPATTESVERLVVCEIQGIGEQVPVRVITGDARRELLEQRDDFLNAYYGVLTRFGQSSISMQLGGEPLTGPDPQRFAALLASDDSPLVALQCRRRLPNQAEVALVWNGGVTTDTGVAGTETRRLAYRVRDEFRATFSCTRANADAHCIPVLPMTLTLSAPITRAAAESIRLVPSSGRALAPVLPDRDGIPAEWIQTVAFPGPHPEGARFRVEIPGALRDDAGRVLANQDRFPLEVRTEDSPPLIRFPASFGIIEWHEDGAALPVTLRNLEAIVPLPQLSEADESPPRLEHAPIAPRPVDELAAMSWYARWYHAFRERFWPEHTQVNGRTMRVSDAVEAVHWIERSRVLERRASRYDAERNRFVVDHEPGELSLFTAGDATETFTLPKPHGQRAFEVIGIPFSEPGFYLVEIASPRLGATLYGRDAPYHARTAVLVTSLAVHFKRGRESSLVWVTALDSGLPVAGADITINDCDGQRYAEGRTDDDGLLRIEQTLPEESMLPSCPDGTRAFVVEARHGDDMSFVLSTWNDGIQPWRFSLPARSWQAPALVSTVFDRSLLRAGETVQMKHFARMHTTDGFIQMAPAQLPGRAVVRHRGTFATWEVPLSWDEAGTATGSWTIPVDARQGSYEVLLDVPLVTGGTVLAVSGGFQVESFRVPTMTAALQPVRPMLVRSEEAEVDIQLSYLSGGGAGGAEATLRAAVEPRSVFFAAYRDFTFANGHVQEGREERVPRRVFDEEASPAAGTATRLQLPEQALTLDAGGGVRATLDGWPAADEPRDLHVELEYRDANGETATVAQRVALWPASVIAGLKPQSWVASRDRLAVQALTLDLSGRPLEGTRVEIDVLKRQSYSHRQRLVGGFYGYRYESEVRYLGPLCSGRSDALGFLHCEAAAPADGNLILRMTAFDDDGNTSHAYREVWVADAERWWFGMGDDDRMDLLPEERRYEPGDAARFQVRMPFESATALVTVEREGIIDAFVTTLTGEAPVIELPVLPAHAPNVFVSVLAIRGRIAGIRPDALVDLGKPAYRLGIAEIDVGWRAHELDVRVEPDREIYQVRDTATVTVQIARADGGPLPPGTELAFAAVDEGLLELKANDSWRLLDAMMGRRGLEVMTSTAQMQVVGRRHFGRKAVASGGGGGQQGVRELFDTLLMWEARVPVDADGRATIEVPLNDSLTAFRLVAVAHAGAQFFGTGATSIRSTRELMLLSGLPPMVREGDVFDAMVTVRNASPAMMESVNITATPRALSRDGQLLSTLNEIPPQVITLAAGESREVSWRTEVPVDASALEWTVTATAGNVSDAVGVAQQVIPAVPVSTQQATLEQVAGRFELQSRMPSDAVRGRGGLELTLSRSIAAQLDDVRERMRTVFCARCLELRVSQAVALQDLELWSAVMHDLPAYVDEDGLLTFFPGVGAGEDTLTAYVLAIAHEAGWAIPDDVRASMINGLVRFADGRLTRGSPLPTADLAIRRLAALAAVARYTTFDASLLTTFDIDLQLWPTSALLDYMDLLSRHEGIPARGERLQSAENLLRARLDLRGTVLGFSTERADYLWWLMVSPDVNANRAILNLLEMPDWQQDLPRLVRGSLGRQQRGAWNTSVANAWGVLAMLKFAERFESAPVTGVTRSEFGTQASRSWDDAADQVVLEHPWPAESETTTLRVEHEGDGRPWLMARSRAAVPRSASVSSGFTVEERTITPVVQQEAGRWQRGDVARISLAVEAQSDMTWVVVTDPVPAGTTILGTGLGRDSRLLMADETRRGLAWTAFEERTPHEFRAFYRFVPKGSFTVEYTVRFNNAGTFVLPSTRVEAMYAPEMFGELPNTWLTVDAQ